MNEIKKIEKQSQDIRKDLISKLKQLYPPLFDDEGNLNEQELKNLVRDFSSTTTGRYEFNWASKMSAKRNAFKVSRATLKPDTARSIDFDTTQNLILEGDNLEVLKLLQKSYFNKIKCIYIDPPYNTGNDFIYSDNFTEGKKAYWEQNGVARKGVKLDSNTETQGRYHSNWLNMIYPRLLLARNLLKDDGVIFVSIDDNEVHNLRKAMDEIFGEENFVANIIWQKKYSPQNDATYFSNMHDHILCYAKLKKYNTNELIGWERNLFPRTKKQDDRYSNPDNDLRGKWKSSDMSVKTYLASYDYEITTPSGRKVKPPKGRCWRFSREKYKKMIKDDRIWFGKDGNSIPSTKRFLSEVKQGIVPSTIWFREEVGDNQEAAKEIRELFPEYPPFDTPKPTRLIKRIEILATSSNDIILDFFAGSGTTAHAVMELNKEDGGNRKYILVQLPEATHEKSEAYKAGYKTISDICIERVKRVSEKIKKEDEGKLVKETENLDLGFKVFRLAPSFFPENLFTPLDHTKTEAEKLKAFEEYLAEEGRQLKLKFDDTELLYEILLKSGFELNFKQEQLMEFDKNKIYRISDTVKETLICLDYLLDDSDATIEKLQQYKDEHFILLGRAINTTQKWYLKKIFEQNMVEL